jgi:hypothetical protein
LSQTTAIFDSIEIITYDLVCLVWLIVFLKPQQRTPLQPFEKLDPEMLHHARVWESLLKKWLTPGKSKQ